MRLRGQSYLSSTQAINLIEGLHFAEAQKTPVTFMVSVNFMLADVKDELAFASHFTKLFGDWLGLYRVPRVYAWAREHPPSESSNWHCLVRIPYSLRKGFLQLSRKWLREAGGSWTAGAIHFKRIDFLDGVVAYLLKGVDASCAQTLNRVYGLNVQPKFQGYISGKRTAVAESIGRKARRQAGWVDRCP